MDGSYDAFKSPLFIQNVNGIKTLWQYDGIGRKTLETRPDGNKTTFAYDLITPFAIGTGTAKFLVTSTPVGADNVTNGPLTKTYYDGLRRVIRSETIGFDGVAVIREDTEYSTDGQVARKSKPYYVNAAIQWTSFTYDVLGRLELTTAPDGSQTRTEYDGLTTIETNALGKKRTTLKNGLDQVVKVTDALGNVLTFEYDANGNVTKTIDPQGNEVVSVYDKLGRKTSLVDPDMGPATYEYDALGQLRRQTDAKAQVTTMSYDLIGRMNNRTEADLVSNWTFDSCAMGKGQLCRVTADNGYIVDYSYDSLARPSKNVKTIGSTFTSSITYGTNGKIATQVYPTGLAIKYVYTSLGFLKELRNNATDSLYWQANSLDAEGQLLLQTYGNNVTTQQVFYPTTGRLKNVYAGAGNSVQNFTYTYDPRGNMLSRNDANQNLAETFNYDDLNRLGSNSVNSSGAGLVTQSYTYDSIGNIKSRSDLGTYTYSKIAAGPHAVTSITAEGGLQREYGYDANGNQYQDVRRDVAGNLITSKGRSETYTSFNMPASFVAPGATLSFVYGPVHERIKQITPSGTTIYVHPDNIGALAYEKFTKADNSVEHRHYVSVAGRVVAMLRQTSAGTNAFYMHRDQLGSSTAVTNEAGAVVERMSYEPFGKRRSPSGALDPESTINGTITDRGYTNHEHIDEVGLINMNGRVYDPDTARFISADPNVPYGHDIQSYSRFSYTRNNPLVMVDPSGFEDIDTVIVTGKKLFQDSVDAVRDRFAKWGGGGTVAKGPSTSAAPEVVEELPCILPVISPQMKDGISGFVGTGVSTLVATRNPYAALGMGAFGGLAGYYAGPTASGAMTSFVIGGMSDLAERGFNLRGGFVGAVLGGLAGANGDALSGGTMGLVDGFINVKVGRITSNGTQVYSSLYGGLAGFLGAGASQVTELTIKEYNDYLKTNCGGKQ